MGDMDENATRDMNKFVRQCSLLIDALSCAVVLIHHTNKYGEYRGSSSLFGAVDAFIRITDEDDIIRVENHKQKDHKGGSARYYRLQPVDTGKFDDEGQVVYTPVVVEVDPIKDQALQALTTKQRRVIEVAGMEVYRDGVTFGELLDITRYSRPTLARILDVLIRRGYVAQDHRRDPYKITDKGVGLLGQGEDAEVTEVAKVALVHQASSRVSCENKKTNATNATTATGVTEARARDLFGVTATHYDYEG